MKPYRDALDQRLATLSKEAAAAQATAMKPVEVELTACVDLRGKAEAHVRAAAPGNLTEAMAKDEEDLKASATKRLVAAAASATVGDEVEEGLENLKDKLPFGGFGD